MPIDYNDWKEFVQGKLNCKVKQDGSYYETSFEGKSLNEDVMPTCIKLDTQTLINSLEGESKQYVLDIAKQQAEEYGNINVWSARVYDYLVEINMGEWFMGVYFDKDTHNIEDTIGNARGSRYELRLLQIANELHNMLQDL